MSLKKLSVATVAVATVVAPLALATPAQAVVGGATRTWVSGVGDDVNPCSRTAPCKTFAGAISKTADGGEINALDSAGFGAVTINAPVTISAVGVIGGVLVSGTNGITVSGNVAVTLRGLDINGLGTSPNSAGVKVTGAATVHVEDSEIYGFGTGVAVTPTTGTAKVFVDNTRIHGNTQAGLQATAPAGGSANVQVTGSHVDDNGCGLVASLAGTASGPCQSSGGTGTGDGTVEIDSSGTTAIGNGVGVLANGTGAAQQMSGNTVSGNTTGLQQLAGGVIVNVGANSTFGNTTNGNPTIVVSTGPTGPAGPAGATGATGATGPAGAAGKVQLVTCKTVKVATTKVVKGKKTKVYVNQQKCTTKTVSTTVTFTTKAKSVTARFSRGGHTVASGTGFLDSKGSLVQLALAGHLSAGSYTMTLTHGATRVRSSTVTIH